MLTDLQVAHLYRFSLTAVFGLIIVILLIGIYEMSNSAITATLYYLGLSFPATRGYSLPLYRMLINNEPSRGQGNVPHYGMAYGVNFTLVVVLGLALYAATVSQRFIPEAVTFAAAAFSLLYAALALLGFWLFLGKYINESSGEDS